MTLAAFRHVRTSVDGLYVTVQVLLIGRIERTFAANEFPLTVHSRYVAFQSALAVGGITARFAGVGASIEMYGQHVPPQFTPLGRTVSAPRAFVRLILPVDVLDVLLQIRIQTGRVTAFGAFVRLETLVHRHEMASQHFTFERRVTA